MKHKISITESHKEDHNLVINRPSALRHHYASAEDGGRVFRQIFSFLSTMGHRFYEVSMWNGAWMRNAYRTQTLLLCSLVMLASQDVFQRLKVVNSR